MFLSKKNKLINNVRHRKELIWKPFLIKKIKKQIKNISYNFISNKLNAFIYKGFFKNKFNKKIYNVITDKENNNLINFCKYGFNVGNIQLNFKYNFNSNLYEINKCNLLFIKSGYFIHHLQNLFNGNKIAFADGTYCIILKNFYDLNLVQLKLPSGKIKIYNNYWNAYIGRCGNIYKKYIVWGSWGFKYKNKKHVPVVRGVAMNPIDHPNGGRTKVKKPFKNKYNKIAKMGK